MIFDSHIHTKFSTDSDMLITSAIDRAKELNLGLVLTEHLDLAYPEKDEFKLDVPKYLEEYQNYRNDHLLLGIEIGLSTNFLKENKKISSSYNFDYIIAAMHAVYDEDIYLTYCHKGLSKDTYFSTYLENSIENIKKFDNFDSFAHIDYPCRYSTYNDNELYYSDYSDLIDELLITLINKNKLLELNVRRFNNKASITALLDIYKRYKELGGKYITLGSDAHYSDAIGYNFKDAFDFLEECNLQGVYFKNRNMKGFK